MSNINFLNFIKGMYWSKSDFVCSKFTISNKVLSIIKSVIVVEKMQCMILINQNSL